MDIEKNLDPHQPITAVERIIMGTAIPGSRETLPHVVEAPLLEACLEFYDKNIRTVVSSANETDLQNGFAYIVVELTSMSNDNRQIAEEMGAEHFVGREKDGTTLEFGVLKLPVNPLTTIEDLSKRAVERAGKFKIQPMTWAPTYSLGDVKQREHLEELTDEELIIKMDAEVFYFFDPDERIFYMSEEHYHKVHPEVDEK